MNGFKDSELVLVGGRELATIAGRLRLAHEGNEKLSITSAVVVDEPGVRAVVHAEVITKGSTFSATGTASKDRDAKLVHALLEVAETRAVARALRFAGFGYEIGVEEMDDAAFQSNTVPDARGTVAPAPLGRINPAGELERRPRRGGTPATAAQRRCIEALARRVHVDPGALVARFAPGIALEDLDIGSASRLIHAAKRAAGANGSNGAGGTNNDGR